MNEDAKRGAGRNVKKGVDYFPHFTNSMTHSSTIFTIQEDFGNDGYAVWYKLLEYLGTQEKLYFDTNDRQRWKHFVALCKTSQETVLGIINSLAEMNAIDYDLWTKHKVIWSDNFADNVASVYKKRGVAVPTKPVFLNDTESKEFPQTEPVMQLPEIKSSFDGDKMSEFCERFNVQVDSYGSALSEIDFDLLTKAYEESPQYLQTSNIARFMSWVVKNYASIIKGKYKLDSKSSTSREQQAIDERRRQNDMMQSLYNKYLSEEDDNG